MQCAAVEKLDFETASHPSPGHFPAAAERKCQTAWIRFFQQMDCRLTGIYQASSNGFKMEQILEILKSGYDACLIHPRPLWDALSLYKEQKIPHRI